MERKLAVILVADIVGYSAQMEKDEAGTYARVTTRRRDIFEPEIARHQGRIFKLVGDGLLAEFGSAVQAVECAMALQRSLAERNADVAQDQRILVRIGINLGEVIVEGDDRLGEGVNIAARLEQLAEPGGICVSEKVAREVERKLAFGFESMGERRVKNIAEPIHVYRVSADATKGVRRAVTRRPRRVWVVVAAVVLIASIVLASLGYVVMRPAPLTGPPTLAVLPFDNLTGDATRDYLSLAVPDGIGTILSGSPVLRVGARAISLSSDPADGAKRIAWRLGVDFLLEGSLQQTTGGLEVSARLVDGRSADVIWLATFGQQGQDVAALQEAVAREVYVQLGSAGGVIAARNVPLAWDRLTDDPQEYDYFLRGAGALLAFTEVGRRDAERILTEGITRFPQTALLRIMLASVHVNRVLDGVSDDYVSDIDTAWALLGQASGKKDMTSLERWLLHYIRAITTRMATGNHAGGLADAIEAQRLVPFEPQANFDVAEVAALAGRPDLAVAWAEFAVASQPPGTNLWGYRLAWSRVLAGQNDAALEFYDNLKDPCRDCYAVALVRAGRVDEARKVIAAWVAEDPDISLDWASVGQTERHPYMVEPLLTDYLDDLRKAGLK